MTAIIIIVSALLTILLIFYIWFSVEYNMKTKEVKDWEINDDVIVKQYYMMRNGLTYHNGREYAQLKGWTTNNIYLDFGDNITHKLEWNCFEHNKSALWRRNFEECKKVMGKNPAFQAGFKSTPTTSKEKIDGKPIELLTEIECQVYLKQAIQSENYELAERIRKQMEKFR